MGIPMPIRPFWPNRIQVDVSRQMLEVFIGIYQQGFEASLKQVPAALPLDIEIDGVTDIDPLNGLAQVGLGGLHQQVVVVGHQAVSVNSYRKP